MLKSSAQIKTGERCDASSRENPLPEFIDEEELLRRIPICRRTLFEWRKQKKIPFVQVGPRRIIFHWPSVKAALLRFQEGEWV
jgi:hypothetical protein